MKKETLVTTLGTASEIHPNPYRGAVNMPVYRASTILFNSLAEFEAADNGKCAYPTYGRFGTPSTEALEMAIATLEGADYSIVTASGLSAIACSMLAFLNAGDHLLMVDSVYGPTRRLCDGEFKRLGIETTYYDPCIGAGIADLIRENTKVIFTEIVGSLSFEVQDIPAISAAAHARGVVVVSDNTWATPFYINPFELGVDVSVHSATKYIAGHSDLVMGVLSCRGDEHYKKLLRTFRNFGARASGDECYLALRGLRTMAVRLKQHAESGLRVANWLEKRPEVAEVLHPALPSFAGHDIWKRDFSGATSLFSIVLKDGYSHDALAAMVDGLEHFGMGYSWGGFESLLITCHLDKIRTATKWERKGFVVRLHIGLENADDLIADLEAGFARLVAN